MIPVINKIDLPQAEPERVKKEIEEIIGIDASEAISVSAKDGTNLNELMKQIAQKVPPPKKSIEANLQALIIDSWYDNFLGVISLIRIFSGSLIYSGHHREIHSKKNSLWSTDRRRSWLFSCKRKRLKICTSWRHINIGKAP